MNRPPPISRLPPDALARILWYATGPYDRWRFYQEPSLYSTSRWLLALGSVCSQWYRVTRSSPQLWTTVALNPKREASEARNTDYASLLRYHYKHAGSNALNVYLSRWDDMKGAATVVDEILKVALVEHPGTLKSLHIGHSCKSVWPPLLQYAAKECTEFSKLERLDFKWTPQDEESLKKPIFHNSPHLRILSLTGAKLLTIPCAQLTELKLTDTSFQSAFGCLLQCPQLVEFGYAGSPPPSDSPWIPNEGAVTLQSLRRLSWTAFGPADAKFLENLRLPSLRCLEWKHATLPSNDPPIRDFFAQMENLEELHFSALWNPNEQFGIEHHLHCFKNLEKLEITIISQDDEDPAFSDGWFHRLTIKPETKNLFPRLQILRITVSDVAPHGLLVILCSRRNGPVEWSDPNEQYPEDLAVTPYDPASSHWKGHSRLMEFRYESCDSRDIEMNWTWSPHYPALKAMISEAKCAKADADVWEQTSWTKLIF